MSEKPPVTDPAFNRLSKPLSQSRVAIVTTAGLRLADQDKFAGGDQSFRVLPATTDGLILDQISPNFDRIGFHHRSQRRFPDRPAKRDGGWGPDRVSSLTAFSLSRGPR